jgi:hypothetical protein
MESGLLYGSPKDIKPHCGAVVLSVKPSTTVIVTGGISGELIINSHDSRPLTIHAIGSPITALVAIDNSPLIVAGTLDGCVLCVHLGKQRGPDDHDKLISTVLMKQQVSCQAVTNICYQRSTKKLAFATSSEATNCQVTVACMEPNNMKVIGTFQAPGGIDTLAWGRDDFKLFVGHDTSISCFNVIGMTFKDNAEAERLWTKSTGQNRLRTMTVNSDGTLMYTIDGRKKGIYSIALPNDGESDDALRTMYYEGENDVSAASCFLLDVDQIIVGSISGEISACQLGNKGNWKMIYSHTCAVTSIVSTKNGFCSVGMDGSLKEHQTEETGKECNCKETTTPSSSQWDYLVRTWAVSF